ncbi:MAG: transglutaminase family protein, partial [Planctomycetaceae bacterium]|nr:transglutaminase family protein [Planctomycetaceae bacterium]
APAPASTRGATPAQTAAAADAPAAIETWDAVYLKGNHVGYIHSKIEAVQRQGRPLAQTTVDTRLWLTRFGQASDQQILVTSNETADGRILDFVTEARLGPAPLICRGRVADDRLLVESTAGGQTTRREIPWDPQVGGFAALERELLRRPLRPGDRRTHKLLVPLLSEVLVAEVQLQALDYAQTPLLAGDYELLEVDSQTTLPGGLKMNSRLWVNRAGEVLKTRMEAFDQVTYRSSRAVAEQRLPEKPFDLGFDSVVRIDPPLDDPHAAREIRYRIELKDGDPAGVFIDGGTQATKLSGPSTIELTVKSQRPGDDDLGATEPAPGHHDSAPNNLIQSNDPKVMELAAAAAGSETDPWKTAMALEKFVQRHIQKKGFSHAFATAADVARQPEGDCTEHAVLLAALCRARGIPARVATGLVYTSTPAGFGFHMWNEVYIAGHWIPLDATLARGGIGAGHIKLAHSNLQDASALGCFLPVAQVLGRLKIDVLEVK